MKPSYSLWITPPLGISKILQNIIDHLAVEFKGERFEPHLTLLGEIEGEESEVLDKAKKLAGDLGSFKIELGVVSFSTTYFQNVFVRVKSNAALMSANMLAKKIYNFENNVFMPHISLLYGNHDMKDRELIASRVEIPEGLSFIAENLVLIPNTPVIEGWKPIATLPLIK